MAEITPSLSINEQGEPQASENLLPLVYAELRQLAAQRLTHEPAGQTLQATALVHEAYLRLVEGGQCWNSRGHFFRAAAEAMRRILIEKARRKQRLRHGGGRKRLDLDDLERTEPAVDENLLVLDEALGRLEAAEPTVAQVVKLRFFAGLGVEEAAQTLGISIRTAKRHWAFARAWLFQELRQQGEGEG